jgi:mannose-1-phosphate guanylyltransferase/mannose-6-phosphate isomerase
MLHAVILAGGSGTRLWPLSRAHYPKQFLQLFGPYTLLQQTIFRVHGLIPAERVWVVTGAEQESIVRSQLSRLPDFAGDRAQILVEPCPRNTAAAVGLAAIHIRRHDPQAVMVVLPADHWIEQQSGFVDLVRRAALLAQLGVLVTLGIVPDRPETGYGYICRGRPFTADGDSAPDGLGAYRVKQFVEKPDLASARRYVTRTAYYWNAGIFLWRVDTILREIAANLPRLRGGLEELASHISTDQEKNRLAAVYPELPAISIDYGILEKSSSLVVIPADIGWSDLGDWTAIHRLSPHDGRGNTLSPNVVAVDNENSFIYSNGRTIATIGLKNTVVVDAADALLICPRERVQEVKTIAQQLQLRHAETVPFSHPVPRPWGTYSVLQEGPGFKVKRLIILPGAALSLQLHSHRNEHWVVVAGVALVRNGDSESTLRVGQSADVPQGTIHRVTNPGATPLEIIEVQTGSYLGEDDIVRLEDLYSRA